MIEVRILSELDKRNENDYLYSDLCDEFGEDNIQRLINIGYLGKTRIGYIGILQKGHEKILDEKQKLLESKKPMPKEIFLTFLSAFLGFVFGIIILKFNECIALLQLIFQ